MAKKKNNVLLIGLILILVLAIGLSYGYYLLSKVQENNNVVGSKCFKLELASEENNINLNNMYPISDEEGKSLTPYTFTLKNTCDMTASYTLSMEMLEGTTLNSKYVDVMVNNGEIKLLNSYDEANTVLTGSTESRILDKGLLASNTTKDYSIRFWMDKNVEDIDSMNKSFQSKIIVDSTPINYDGQIVYDFDYTGGEQTFIAPVSGTYKLETWGAQGGDSSDGLIGGLGGYASGNIDLKEAKHLYIYVGGAGRINGSNNQELGEDYTNKYFGSAEGGYNGGGVSGNQSIYNGSGGGSTDLRIVSGNWNSYDSLKSRIIVAGGGGGSSQYQSILGQGGSGGGLFGNDGSISSSYYNDRYSGGGKQNSNGYSYYEYGVGNFGMGGHGSLISNENVTRVDGGGGSGYYGGAGGGDYGAGGAGGSSFISGHNGCDAIKEESTENNIIHTGQSIHYSGLYFTNTLMIDGDGYKWTDKKEEQIGMPSHSNNSIIMGNSGNGYARITLVSIDE